jgi:hypothetical protein
VILAADPVAKQRERPGAEFRPSSDINAVNQVVLFLSPQVKEKLAPILSRRKSIMTRVLPGR